MEKTSRRCSSALWNWPTQVHRRVLVLIDSYYTRKCVSRTGGGCVPRSSRSVSVCWRARLARYESSGLSLDLVEGEVDGRKVGSREMGVERPGRVEEGREVRGHVGCHRVVVVVEVSEPWPVVNVRLSLFGSLHSCVRRSTELVRSSP